MDLAEIRVSVPARDYDTAEAVVTMASPQGFWAEDYRDLENEVMQISRINLIDEDLLAKNREVCVFHIFVGEDEHPGEIAQFVAERLRACGVSFELENAVARESDWAEKWKQYFHISPVGEKLLIVPSWEEAPADTGGRKIISIDPGAAFGTGTHETTRLCLTALEKYARPGVRVLDVGCGSGILSVAALLLGADSATGVDIDPLAVSAAEENGAKNGFLPPRYTVLEGDLVECVEGRYGLVLANIAADAVMALSGSVKKFLEPDGVFLASGIIDSRVDEVRAKLEKEGFTIQDEAVDGPWSCYACVADR